MIRINPAAQIRFEFLSLCLLVQGSHSQTSFSRHSKLVVQEKL